MGEYSSKFGVSHGKIYIKSQRTKWASCSSLKNLSFNFRLVHLPPELVRYVVCHEVLHLVERGHTRSFWERLAQEFPNYREMEKKLLEYWFFLEELDRKEGW